MGKRSIGRHKGYPSPAGLLRAMVWLAVVAGLTWLVFFAGSGEGDDHKRPDCIGAGLAQTCP